MQLNYGFNSHKALLNFKAITFSTTLDAKPLPSNTQMPFLSPSKTDIAELLL
jgi:hypothetical protein